MYDLRPCSGVCPDSDVVEQHPEDDDGRAEAREEGHLVAEEQYGGPDEEGPLASVRHAEW